MMMSLVVTMDQRQAVRREMIQQMEQGATASDVRRLCPIPIHRTTVYRLLKRVVSSAKVNRHSLSGDMAIPQSCVGTFSPGFWSIARATLLLPVRNSSARLPHNIMGKDGQ